MLIQASCRVCKSEKLLEVDKEGFEKWKNREALIQDALPNLDKKDRELLISKTCGDCWTLLFGDEE